VTEIEPNDAPLTHHMLSLPVTVQGTISGTENAVLAVRGDPIEDFYRVDTKTRGQLHVRLTASPANVNLDVYVLGEAFQLLNPGTAGWGPSGMEEMTVTTPAGIHYVVVTAPPGALSDDSRTPAYELEIDFRPFAWEYTAKIVCGTQSDPDDMRLGRGRYATTVNIHNPGSISARVFKKLALAYPPEEQKPGVIVEIGEDTLGYDAAVKTDCMDIRENVFKESGFPADYIEGFVVVQSTEALDVTSVYTTNTLDSSGAVGQHSSIDVEQIDERGLGVDLQINKSAEIFPVRFGDRQIYFILYTIDVENLGPAKATEVRIADTLTLDVSGADGIAGLLPLPLDLPPGGALESLEQPSLTESSAEFLVGDIAVGTTRTLRFWALAFAVPDSRVPIAVLNDTAQIRSGEAELLDADNTTSVETQLLP